MFWDDGDLQTTTPIQALGSVDNMHVTSVVTTINELFQQVKK